MSRRPARLGHERQAPLVLGDANGAQAQRVKATGLFHALRKDDERWVTGSQVAAGLANGSLVLAGAQEPLDEAAIEARIRAEIAEEQRLAALAERTALVPSTPEVVKVTPEQMAQIGQAGVQTDTPVDKSTADKDAPAGQAADSTAKKSDTAKPVKAAAKSTKAAPAKRAGPTKR